ncbi:MAG: hypothetical protein WC662_00590 [Candidatus Paceibacterota bacterium]|jgi:hypothetical protein
MAKTFFPKKVELSENMKAKLKKDFNLSNNQIAEIEYWNDPGSPYGGVIIDLKAQFPCYPYDRDTQGFMKEFPDGTVLENIP